MTATTDDIRAMCDWIDKHDLPMPRQSVTGPVGDQMSFFGLGPELENVDLIARVVRDGGELSVGDRIISAKRRFGGATYSALIDRVELRDGVMHDLAFEVEALTTEETA
ncbi:MAG: hypothetical protein J0H98_08245 [Solirubrobacterales bacterium]|nr:hypothetical protein [Solirubrobacterales bacterium]